MSEFIKFCTAGIITFIIDYGLLFILTELWHLNYLISSAFAFTIAVIINYLLCRLFVFPKGQFTLTQFLSFIFVSIIGLLLNQFCMWFFVEVIKLYYLIAKIVATAIVTLWNYIFKKKALK